MRGIKFRAFCNPFRIMCRVSDIDFINSIVSVVIDEERAIQDCYDFDQIEIMQFTGLLDQNGTEIYEGDILTGMFSDLFNNGAICHRRNVTVIHFLEQQGFCSGFNFEHMEDGLSAFNVPPLKYEIIGNKYEHPHLLAKSEAKTLNSET